MKASELQQTIDEAIKYDNELVADFENTARHLEQWIALLNERLLTIAALSKATADAVVEMKRLQEDRETMWKLLTE